MALFEIKKAIDSIRHPGIRTTPLKLIRNASRYYLARSMHAAPPLTIYWSINSICNLKCKMCDVGTGEEGLFFKTLRIDRKLHEIEISRFKSVIDDVWRDRPFISINSTEPLMYKELPEAVEYCTAKGLQTGVTTGGYLLPKKAADLAAAGLKRLNVSIDGPSEIHNGIRGRADSFERDVDGIHKFHAAAAARGDRPQIYVNCVISNMNFAHLERLVEALAPVPVTQINFTYLWYISDATAELQNRQYGDRFPVTRSCFGEDIAPQRVDVTALQGQVSRLRGRKNVSFLPFFSQRELNRYFLEPEKFVKNGSKCLASWFFMQILADGNVIPYTRCHNQSLGNINTTPFYDIWNGSQMKEWRRFIKAKKTMPMCVRCDMTF